MAKPQIINDISNLTINKVSSDSPTFSGNVVLPTTTTLGNVSSTEIDYLDGITSSVQTQLNTKTSTGKAIAMSMVFG